MMPLPWVLVFFLIFSCLYSVFLFISFFSFGVPLSSKSLKPFVVALPW